MKAISSFGGLICGLYFCKLKNKTAIIFNGKDKRVNAVSVNPIFLTPPCKKSFMNIKNNKLIRPINMGSTIPWGWNISDTSIANNAVSTMLFALDIFFAISITFHHLI